MKYLLEGQSTERLLFRTIESSDFQYWLKFFQDPQTSLHWKEEKISPELSCQNWYQKQQWRYDNNKGGMNALIEKGTSRLIGHAGLLVQTVDGIEELEIGYSLLPEFWNKGFATEAAGECIRFAFQNNFADSLISIISVTNTSSQQVATKNGMLVDKKTIYRDNEVLIYRITQAEWHQTQPSIRK
jgi:ribosomal-protein-alanine N-acetyltransferase